MKEIWHIFVCQIKERLRKKNLSLMADPEWNLSFRQHMQKWKAILLVAAILVQSFYCPVMAREARFLETAAPVLDLSAKSAVVMEQESKEILFAKDKDKELAPASVTKIMSLLLIFEDLKQGKIKLTDTVTVSEHAASMGGSQVFL